MNSLDLFHYFAPRTLYALVAGAIVGFERARKQKTAGLKTNILICFGAMLYTSIAELSGHDASRIISNIVTGIGFLGAGAIIHPTAAKVSGLTTAAMMWSVAALGILVALDHGLAAIVLSVVISVISAGVSAIEKKLLPSRD